MVKHQKVSKYYENGCRAILKILYFSGDYQFSRISTGIKFLYDQGRILIHLLGGRHNLGPGRQFQQVCLPGKLPGRITQEDLDRVYEWNLLSEVFVGSKIKEVIREEKMEKTKARKELK